jgi:hypothetical protein
VRRRGSREELLEMIERERRIRVSLLIGDGPCKCPMETERDDDGYCLVCRRCANETGDG